MAMDLKGFERLAGCMLLQAMADIRSGSVKHRGLALEWLNGKTDENLSFAHCCRILGRDPGEVRDTIFRGLNQGSADLDINVITPDPPFVVALT